MIRFEEFVQDAAFALRTLRRKVTYSVIVMVTPAFGIASNTLIFSLMVPCFLRPLPHKDASSLVQLGLVNREWDANLPITVRPMSALVYSVELSRRDVQSSPNEPKSTLPSTLFTAARAASLVRRGSSTTTVG